MIDRTFGRCLFFAFLFFGMMALIGCVPDSDDSGYPPPNGYPVRDTEEPQAAQDAPTSIDLLTSGESVPETAVDPLAEIVMTGADIVTVTEIVTMTVNITNTIYHTDTIVDVQQIIVTATPAPPPDGVPWVEFSGDGSAVSPDYYLGACEKGFFDWSNEGGNFIAHIHKGQDSMILINALENTSGQAFFALSGGTYYLNVTHGNEWALSYTCED